MDSPITCKHWSHSHVGKVLALHHGLRNHLTGLPSKRSFSLGLTPVLRIFHLKKVLGPSSCAHSGAVHIPMNIPDPPLSQKVSEKSHNPTLKKCSYRLPRPSENILNSCLRQDVLAPSLPSQERCRCLPAPLQRFPEQAMYPLVRLLGPDSTSTVNILPAPTRTKLPGPRAAFQGKAPAWTRSGTPWPRPLPG